MPEAAIQRRTGSNDGCTAWRMGVALTAELDRDECAGGIFDYALVPTM
jgi:hypothetical protein